MVSKDFWVLLAMVIYFVAMLIIGFVYSKRSNSSTRQYFAGGRGVGPWLTALSAEASDMSGWLLLGVAGGATKQPLDWPGRPFFPGARRSVMDGVGPGHRHLSELETRGPTSTSLFGGRR